MVGGRLAASGRLNVLAPLVMAESVAAERESTSIPQRHAVIDALVTITLYPSGRGRRNFDAGFVLPSGTGSCGSASAPSARRAG